MVDNNIIAIDGSSWTGKSTVSKALANFLGYKYINTGAMFRAIALICKMKNLNFDNHNKIIEVTKETKIEFKRIGDETNIYVNNINFEQPLENPELATMASKIAVIPEVREIFLKIQREIGKEGEIVIEGRDVGTKIFPNAEWKFFLDATLKKRAERLNKVMKEQSKEEKPIEELMKKIEERDSLDRNREVAPLRKANDAIVYDNSDSPSEYQDALILQYYINHTSEIIKNATLLINHNTEKN